MLKTPPVSHSADGIITKRKLSCSKTLTLTLQSVDLAFGRALFKRQIDYQGQPATLQDPRGLTKLHMIGGREIRAFLSFSWGPRLGSCC